MMKLSLIISLLLYLIIGILPHPFGKEPGKEYRSRSGKEKEYERDNPYGGEGCFQIRIKSNPYPHDKEQYTDAEHKEERESFLNALFAS